MKWNEWIALILFTLVLPSIVIVLTMQINDKVKIDIRKQYEFDVSFETTGSRYPLNYFTYHYDYTNQDGLVSFAIDNNETINLIEARLPVEYRK